MFYLNLWKVLSDVASAQCNARVYSVTFLLGRRKGVPEHGEAPEMPSTDEGQPR